VSEASQAVTPLAYPTVSLARFVAEPEPEYPMLVEGLGLPAIGTIMLGGPPKSLKTLLMTQLALCASTVVDDGRGWLPFLDYPIARGGPVLFVEEEGGRAPLRRRIERQRLALAASPAVDFLLFAGIRLDNEQSFRRLQATVRHLSPALVVLDPFSFLHGQDENKPAAMAPIMKRLSGLSTVAETCIVLIHHVTKPQADRPSGRLGDRIRGASSITAGVDGFLLLDRKGDDRAQLRGEFRDHEPIDLLIELDPETLLLHRVDTQRAAGKVDPEALLVFAGEQPRVTARDVMARFGVAKPTALAALEDSGLDRTEGPRNQLIYFRRDR
jgi:RecA-family ATPase